ncbi:hypothetical protein Leryth_003493 [Lithospermum erythrorhizon]|nr:hypothetical protein Leryth_003493 [Lithospermum erythrorhizon]
MSSMPMSSPTSSSPSKSMNNMKDHVMHMSFFWGKDVILLFQGWPDNDLGMYILALALVFLIALIVELLATSPSSKPAENRPFLGGLMQASVYAIRMALSYLIMLSVMSFNIGVFVAAVVGHFCGCFIIKFREIRGASTSANSKI